MIYNEKLLKRRNKSQTEILYQRTARLEKEYFLTRDARQESCRGAGGQFATNEIYICQLDKIVKQYRYS
jgi:hypothetical protein